MFLAHHPATSTTQISVVRTQKFEKTIGVNLDRTDFGGRAGKEGCREPAEMAYNAADKAAIEAGDGLRFVSWLSWLEWVEWGSRAVALCVCVCKRERERSVCVCRTVSL